MTAEERMHAYSPGGGRYTVALAGTWECGNCGANGDGCVEEGEEFASDHVCGEDDAEAGEGQ